jgi:hypothetical protein
MTLAMGYDGGSRQTKEPAMKAAPSIACLAALLLALPAQAQPGAQAATDCAKARAPQRCGARQAAAAACQDKRGPERRQCIDDRMPPPDCAKARNPTRCEAMNQAKAACQGKAGKEHRLCLRNQLKPAAPAAKAKTGSTTP